jgi:hypothetical protein
MVLMTTRVSRVPDWNNLGSTICENPGFEREASSTSYQDAANVEVLLQMCCMRHQHDRHVPLAWSVGAPHFAGRGLGLGCTQGLRATEKQQVLSQFATVTNLCSIANFAQRRHRIPWGIPCTTRDGPSAVSTMEAGGVCQIKERHKRQQSQASTTSRSPDSASFTRILPPRNGVLAARGEFGRAFDRKSPLVEFLGMPLGRHACLYPKSI